jgi:Uma2 family endonuclease
MSAQIKGRYSLEDYFELERTSEEKWEWFNGEIFCMSGVSPNHGLVEINFAALLSNKLLGRNCRVFPADVRIKTPAAPPYRYADLSVLCGDPVYENIGGIEALTNPALIIEILSPSTEAYDRGDKFTYYKSIPSLVEYLLVAQHRPHVSQFIKQDDGTWNQREVNDLSESLDLTAIDCTLQLGEVYRGIEFTGSKPTLVSPEQLA